MAKRKNGRVRRRKCGSCTECCTAPSVAEIGKPPAVRCQHLGPERCSIYEDMPASCSVFRCGWLQGLLHIVDRPDRSGIIVVQSARMGVPTIQVTEAWKGSSEEPKGKAVVTGLAKIAVVSIVRPWHECRAIIIPSISHIAAVVTYMRGIEELGIVSAGPLANAMEARLVPGRCVDVVIQRLADAVDQEISLTRAMGEVVSPSKGGTSETDS